ncbi:MAG: zinc-ribbon domain-containing protein [Bacteroidales bacterium]|nr:zinc-ribbon domain-containing protein [Bacteroidales bacterium]
MRCPRCGNSVSDSESFCPYCGQQMTDEVIAKSNGILPRSCRANACLG